MNEGRVEMMNETRKKYKGILELWNDQEYAKSRMEVL